MCQKLTEMNKHFDILFLSCAYDTNHERYFMENSKRGYQFAAQNLQQSIIKGFTRCEIDFTVLSKPALSTYPGGYQKPFVKSFDFIHNGNVIGKSISYINLPFLNNYGIGDRHFIKKWINHSLRPKVIIVYALLPYSISTAHWIKKTYPDTKIVVIVPDLMENMGSNKYYRKFGLQKRDMRYINKVLPLLDGAIILSENMYDRINMKGKPYMVMEGILNEEAFDFPIINKRKAILYTGNIGERYNIKGLINAFNQSIKLQEFELWIRGNGNCEEFVKEAARLNNRIKLFPCMEKKKLVQLEKEASLLINPVLPSTDFTKFFFPSKTLDYLYSGTPILMYKLKCLPTEYDRYMYLIQGESVEELQHGLEETCLLSPAVLEQKGKLAYEFVISEKNPKTQCEKIMTFINTLF